MLLRVGRLFSFLNFQSQNSLYTTGETAEVWKMSAAQTRLLFHLNKFHSERVEARKESVSKSIREVCKIVQQILREVEVQEPRFISSLTEVNGHFEGLQVLSATDFEIVLYLSQMGVFNFVDDGSVPGCAVLKLSDGRKRSMSLWVEFITASGYLSSRKIRSRFQTLVAQALDKLLPYRDSVRILNDSSSSSSEVRLRIRDRYTVQIVPAFKCSGIWPRTAAHWPAPGAPWPMPRLAADVKNEGFDLLSRESGAVYAKDKQQSPAASASAASAASSAEGDAWAVSFSLAESMLLGGGCRRKCLSILKTLRDRHMELPGRPVDSYHLKTLLLYECEKHPHEAEWAEDCIGDRVNGILLQLISCLQNRRCPHYFLPNLDLLRGKSASALDAAAKHTWRILRELLMNSKSLEKL